MLDEKKITKLLERYFKNHKNVEDYQQENLKSGRENFVKVLEFCQSKSKDFPNLDLVASDNPNREYDANFLFTLCDYALTIINTASQLDILSYNHEDAQIFYQDYINLYVSDVSLHNVHNPIENLSIVDKYLRNSLTFTEWLNEVDLKQLSIICELENYIITNCNFSLPSEAITNLGMALHLKREDLIKNGNVDNACIPLFLETNATLGGKNDEQFCAQGSHWVGAVLDIDFKNAEIDICYMNSLDDDLNMQEISSVLASATTFYNNEIDDHGRQIEFKAFPGYRVNVCFDEECLKQPNGWSCGYYAFKNVVDLLPDSGNENLKRIKARDPYLYQTPYHFAGELRNIIYKLLIQNVSKQPEEYQRIVNNDDKILRSRNKISSMIITQSDMDESNWREIQSLSLYELDRFLNDENMHFKIKCMDLMLQILSIPKNFTAEQKINCLIAYLSLQTVNHYLIDEKVPNKIKNYDSLWQPNLNELQVLVRNIKHKIMKTLAEETNHLQKEVRLTSTFKC